MGKTNPNWLTLNSLFTTRLVIIHQKQMLSYHMLRQRKNIVINSLAFPYILHHNRSDIIISTNVIKIADIVVFIVMFSFLNIHIELDNQLPDYSGRICIIDNNNFINTIFFSY